MRMHALSEEWTNGRQNSATTAAPRRHVATVLAWIGVVITALGGARAQGNVVYSETFDGPSVPSNWFAQDGSAGTATLAIVDDTADIGTGNALSIMSATRRGVIGSFDDVSFVNVGDVIELSFDVRLTQFPNNSGGFRFGLYHDNDGLALSSGYRALMGTGTNYLSTDVQADGGDTDIAFGTNRENPPGFQSDLPGISDTEPHSLALILTRTADGVLIDVWQDGASNFDAPVEHITGMGAGTPIPLQTQFNQIAFTTNGGIAGMIDNVQVTYTPIPEPASLVLTGLGAVVAIGARCRWKFVRVSR